MTRLSKKKSKRKLSKKHKAALKKGQNHPKVKALRDEMMKSRKLY